MYRIGHKKRNIKHHLNIMIALSVFSVGIISGLFFIINHNTETSQIQQVNASNQNFDPGNKQKSLKIDTALYSMLLPADWKQLSVNRDVRYDSIQWQMQSGAKNRWLELYVDRLPIGLAFNKILPITNKNNELTVGTISDNCINFTPKINNTDIYVPSKWQGASFLCDLSNFADNIIGVSDKVSGTTLYYSGPKMGKHAYLFVYSDRGIPEDEAPLLTALRSFSAK